MAIHCLFINLIIPIANIDRVYPGGFARFKEENKEAFSKRMWHDEFLFRAGAMSPQEIENMVYGWEKLGLQGVIDKDGKEQWGDMCVVESLFRGLTLPCDWIVFDRENSCVYMKGQPRGEVVGWASK